MTCRVTCIRSTEADSHATDVLSPYVDLARAGRHEDFFWLARSQGMDVDAIEALWRAIRARVVREEQRA